MHSLVPLLLLDIANKKYSNKTLGNNKLVKIDFKNNSVNLVWNFGAQFEIRNSQEYEFKKFFLNLQSMEINEKVFN